MCQVLSLARKFCETPSDIRAKMMVIGELQGPLLVIARYKPSLCTTLSVGTHDFLIGVIDLAGLFVPKQARPVGKSKTTLLSAEGFTNTNCCGRLSDLPLTCIMCVRWTITYLVLVLLMLNGPCDSNNLSSNILHCLLF